MSRRAAMLRMLRNEWLRGAAVAIALAGRLAAQETAFPITVAAKALASQDTTAPDAAMPMQQPAVRLVEPTMPGGKLPQYQLGHRQRDRLTQAHRDTGTLLLSIALPDRELLIRATITIDGEPFPTARRRRIEQLLASNQLSDGPSVSGNLPSELSATPDADDDQPPKIAEYRMTTDSAELLHRYAAAMSHPISADEARWLLANWGDGPELLLLNNHFQSFRADQRPVFHLLDRNRDGAISSDELAMAVQSFQQCDFNHDGIINALEIERAAEDPRGPGSHQSGVRTVQLLSLIADSRGEPDLEFMIEFDSKDNEKSKLTLVSTAPGLNVELKNRSQIPGTITLQMDQHPVAISAVQRTPSDQFSVGAVVDGYPLLPVIDPNNDGKFTVRELRSLIAHLRTFDTDGDGQLTMDETAATTRICFGLGPTVHRELANLRDVSVTETADRVKPPEWFVRMDRNGDDDLTRDEFPGTDEQFDELDMDRNGLISASEAAALDQATDRPPVTDGSPDE